MYITHIHDILFWILSGSQALAVHAFDVILLDVDFVCLCMLEYYDYYDDRVVNNKLCNV